jgi:ribosomal protein S19E (S16A)
MNSIIAFKSLAKKNVFKMKFNYKTFANAFNDKEKVEEKLFIDKNEREIMKKLLSKLQKQGEIDKSHKHDKSPDADALSHLLDRHHKNISEELFEDLLKWKKGQL